MLVLRTLFFPADYTLDDLVKKYIYICKLRSALAKTDAVPMPNGQNQI